MKYDVPRILPFDNRSPEKHSLYPMPLPAGQRVLATTNGTELEIYAVGSGTTYGSIKGFAPDLEQAICDLYFAIHAEPLPGVTVNGQQVYFPGIALDMIIHDREGEGHADKTLAALDEWSFDSDWPCASGLVCAMVLATIPVTALKKGSDTCDLWQRRAHLVRGCARMGAGNPYVVPHPIIRPSTLAPQNWMFPAMGSAAKEGEIFWKQVENCFVKGYVGCLIIDVMQPWAVRGNHYQIITPETYL